MGLNFKFLRAQRGGSPAGDLGQAGPGQCYRRALLSFFTEPGSHCTRGVTVRSTLTRGLSLPSPEPDPRTSASPECSFLSCEQGNPGHGGPVCTCGLGLRMRGSSAQPVPLAPDRPTLASTQLTSFFGALESVLRYRATVLQAFRDMGRFTVNATVLSTRDVLILLHKWSLIERDVRLQEALRAALEKHPVRELLSECQGPRLSPFPSYSVPQSSQRLSRSEQCFQSG